MDHYEVLAADDEADVLRLYAKTIEKAGHIPLLCKSGREAIKKLRDHPNIALILSDLDMNDGSGLDIFRAKNLIDPEIPFYLFSGKTQGETVAYFKTLGLDGYLRKPEVSSEDGRILKGLANIFLYGHEETGVKPIRGREERAEWKSVEAVVEKGTPEATWANIEKIIRSTLMQHAPIKKPVAFFKIGGSSDDLHRQHQTSLALGEALDDLVAIQHEGTYQVVLFVGAGELGTIYKIDKRKFGDREDVSHSHEYNIQKALDINAERYVGIMGHRNAFYIYPDILYGRGLARGIWNEDFESLFNGGRVIVMSMAPRHLGLGKLGPGAIPGDKSDGHTILGARYVCAKTVGLLKRTDGPYLFDPYLGFGTSEWVLQQSKNRQLHNVSLDEFLKCSRIGAEDGDDDHLMERDGLELFRSLPDVEKIAISHIAPYELYHDGLHVVTRQMKPNLPECDYRRQQMMKIIDGTSTACIVK